MEASKVEKKHLYSIDLLRFIATLVIMVAHFTYSYSQAIAAFSVSYAWGRPLRYAYMVVDIFFIISGYVITMTAWQKTPSQFMLGRIVRLYPTYWISCIVFFVVAYFTTNEFGGEKPSWRLLLYNLTMMHEFFGKTAVNPVAWTLTFELSFYFIIFMIISLKLWDHVLIVIAIWLSGIILIGPHPNNSLFYLLTIPRIAPSFIAGMLFFLIKENKYEQWKLYLLLGITFGCSLRSSEATRQIMENFFHDDFNKFIVASMVLLLYGLIYISLFKIKIPKLSSLRVLAELTYSIYLVHNVAIVVFIAIGNKINKYFLLALAIVFSLAISISIYYFVKKWFEPWLRLKLNKLIHVSATESIVDSRY
jgi:peptidoglycan/LPS O-acetylase OafA/YrhL